LHLLPSPIAVIDLSQLGRGWGWGSGEKLHKPTNLLYTHR